MSKPGTNPDSGDILPRLQNGMDSMTRAEVKIARRILAAPDDFVRASVRSAAADLGVSEPTILRFCRAVGCDGFKDLKFRLIQELALSQAMTDQSERATKAAGAVGNAGGAGTGATTASGLRGAVVAGASANSGDTYSQARRTQPGYSDCSSFVDKALHSAGIKPPGATWANTTNFRLAGDWRTIPASQAQPGDIAVSVGHMVLVTGAGGSSAIGQERTGVNVRTGSVASLFGSGTKYVYRTYRGYSSAGVIIGV